VVTFTDVTPLRQAMEETRARVRQQAVLADLGLRALAGKSPDELIADVVRSAAETLKVEFIEVLRLLPDGQTLRLEAGTGWREGTVGSTLPPGADTQEGFTLQFRAPVLVADAPAEKRFARARHLAAHGVVAGVTVLIVGADHPYGVVGAHTSRGRPFTENDVHFLQTLANVLSEALDRHHHDEEMKALAATLEVRIEERTALVQLLHDVTVAANEADTVDMALRFALRRVCEFGGWSLAHVYLVTEAEETTDGAT